MSRGRGTSTASRFERRDGLEHHLVDESKQTLALALAQRCVRGDV